jgi:hypothetical protein
VSEKSSEQFLSKVYIRCIRWRQKETWYVVPGGDRTPSTADLTLELRPEGYVDVFRVEHVDGQR